MRRQTHVLCFSRLSPKACSETKAALAQLPAQPKAGFGNEASSESSCCKPSQRLPTAGHAADWTIGQIQTKGTVSQWLVLPGKYSESLTERNSTEASAAVITFCQMHVKKAGKPASILDALHKNKRCWLTACVLLFRKQSPIYFFSSFQIFRARS